MSSTAIEHPWMFRMGTRYRRHTQDRIKFHLEHSINSQLYSSVLVLKMSSITKLNRNGERGHPWRTPLLVVVVVWEYNTFIMLIYLEKTPCLNIRSKSVFRLSESNAALRSKKTAMVGWQNMALCSRYWRKVKVWSIKPRPGLNPVCCSRIWFSLAGVSLYRITKASSLVMTGVRLIPLWFSHTVFLLFLKIGIWDWLWLPDTLE